LRHTAPLPPAAPAQVASTLAAMPDPTLLLGLAAMALLQIGIGAVCGLLLAPLLGIGPAQLEQQQQQQLASSSNWRGRSSPEAASAIAASMAAASGAPLAARALRPKQPVPATGELLWCCAWEWDWGWPIALPLLCVMSVQRGICFLQMHCLPSPGESAVPYISYTGSKCAGPWQMVAPSAAFGNSFTLPAIFFATLLPGAMADRALGYAALFLLAWSPCLWTIGPALVDSQPGPPPHARGVRRALILSPEGAETCQT